MQRKTQPVREFSILLHLRSPSERALSVPSYDVFPMLQARVASIATFPHR